jgi:hypothetical protein
VQADDGVGIYNGNFLPKEVYRCLSGVIIDGFISRFIIFSFFHVTSIDRLAKRSLYLRSLVNWVCLLSQPLLMKLFLLKPLLGTHFLQKKQKNRSTIKMLDELEVALFDELVACVIQSSHAMCGTAKALPVDPLHAPQVLLLNDSLDSTRVLLSKV